MSEPFDPQGTRRKNREADIVATRSPNGAGPPDSLSAPQDTKSNPSNGLVERLIKALEPFALAAANIPDEIEGFKLVAYVPGGAHARAFKAMNANLTADNFRQAAALYQQAGDLSSQRGEALESILAKLGVVETIMVNKGWHRQAVGGYLTDAGLWLDRTMSELRKLVSHAEGENRSANASLRPGLLGPDTAAVGSVARARLLELSQNLQALSCGFALGAVYGEFPHPEVTLAGDLRAALNASPATPIGGLSDQENSSSSVQIEPPRGLAHKTEGSS